MVVTVRDKWSGKEWTGPTPHEVVQRVWGRKHRLDFYNPVDFGYNTGTVVAYEVTHNKWQTVALIEITGENDY